MSNRMGLGHTGSFGTYMLEGQSGPGAQSATNLCPEDRPDSNPQHDQGI